MFLRESMRTIFSINRAAEGHVPDAVLAMSAAVSIPQHRACVNRPCLDDAWHTRAGNGVGEGLGRPQVVHIHGRSGLVIETYFYGAIKHDARECCCFAKADEQVVWLVRHDTRIGAFKNLRVIGIVYVLEQYA